MREWQKLEDIENLKPEQREGMKPEMIMGKRVFTELPVPPNQLSLNDDCDAYLKAKVII
ncbi:MAG: hypothetical protein RMK18_08345 [Armatimonadota bacterium]|nr:hypothetical protein [Armatimonadota bacterium]MDW8025851.1 hypothetical protein [Armatimonadota bacterium]